MENNKVKRILTMTGLGVMVASSITACGKNKEMQPTQLDQIKEQNAADALAEQKSTEESVSTNEIEEKMTSITLEAELKAHEKDFEKAGYSLETEGLENKYMKLRRFGNNIEVSIEKTIEYLDDLASADEALNKLGEETDTEADKAAEVKEQVQTEQKAAEQTKEVYEGSKSNTTTTQNTAPATPAPADTSSSTASDLEKQASSTTGDSSIANLKPGDTLGDGSTVNSTGNNEQYDNQNISELEEEGRW